MIEDELDKKIRVIQAKKMQKQNAVHSYSKAINNIIKRVFGITKNIFPLKSSLFC